MTKIFSRKMLPWLIWGTAAIFYFVQYVTRISGSVMVPDLMRSFSVDAFHLGALNAFFYYAYVAMQLPVGMLIDRYGTRKLLVFTTLVVALGCFSFSISHHIELAKFSRFLMGFGSAFAFISAIKLATEWFEQKHFGLLTSTTQALGMLGAVAGGAPIAILITFLSWREIMMGFSVIFLVLTFMILLLVKDRTTATERKSNIREVSFRESLLTVIKNPRSWTNGIYIGVLYAPMTAFSELWGVSFLERVYHLSVKTAALAIGVIFIGWAIGAPIVGWISDCIRRRKPILILSALLSLIFLGIVLYAPNLPLPLLFIFLFLFGVSNTGVGVSYAVGEEVNPRSEAGTSVAFANMASVLIGTILQPLIGWLLDLGWSGKMLDGIRYYDASDFHRAMIILIGCFIIGIIFSFLVPETRCRNLMKG
ncbi:MAG: MFS transporter [Gammaproteobacteria bacterium]|nr:MFS transporter [Gammaproteobacteria bacterium]